MPRIIHIALIALALVTGCSAAPSDAETSDTEVAETTEALAMDMKPVLDAINKCRANGTLVGRYREPTAAARTSMEKAMGTFAATGKLSTPSGFSAKKLSATLTLYCQSTNYGGGAYLLRSGAANDAVIEVPHSFYDTGTLEVGLEMFARMNARAMFVNTVHRYKGANCVDKGLGDDDEGCASDVAHSSTSLFQAAHKGMINGSPSLLVYQVHGFAPRPGNPDVVLSNANTVACWTSVADALNEKLPSFLTFEYPADIKELGGTRGMQARHLQNIGGRMMHLELSKPLRTAIGADSNVAQNFVNAVAQAMARESC